MQGQQRLAHPPVLPRGHLLQRDAGSLPEHAPFLPHQIRQRPAAILDPRAPPPARFLDLQRPVGETARRPVTSGDTANRNASDRPRTTLVRANTSGGQSSRPSVTGLPATDCHTLPAVGSPARSGPAGRSAPAMLTGSPLHLMGRQPLHARHGAPPQLSAPSPLRARTPRYHQLASVVTLPSRGIRSSDARPRRLGSQHHLLPAQRAMAHRVPLRGLPCRWRHHVRWREPDQ